MLNLQHRAIYNDEDCFFCGKLKEDWVPGELCIGKAKADKVFKTFPDGCTAVVSSNRRGPCAHSCPEALRRYRRSGLIAYVGTGR